MRLPDPRAHECAPLTRQIDDDARYEALRRRDGSGDGHYVYSVASTGVYCRPSCGARLPLRRNVAFHESAEAAERAGFRPCKRCRPHELSLAGRHAELVHAMRAQLEDEAQEKTLAALAARVGMSPYYLQRLFKQHTGMTPRAYAAAHRLRRVGVELRQGHAVTRALHEAGYSSSSRFYEAESGALGVAPGRLRLGSPGVTIQVLVRPCSLGRVLIAVTARGVCSIAFGDSGADEALHAELHARFPRATFAPADADTEQLADHVVALIEADPRAGVPNSLGTAGADSVPLDLLGTAFQQKVWRALCTIPRGATRSYTELAAEVGAPAAVRAVGTACGKNPIAALVPCHRVLRTDGSLGGYRWGLARKRALLARERE
jgi:AraC family transcriptional regulator of adaptative response/methylated-DNA-[protein]-cysteine methyltransferase